jgi:transcriptional regulator with XRE-family HTH domain
MFSMERFSDWLLNELKSRDMSQSDLARIAGLGRGTISNIMNGTLRLPPETVFRAAGIFPAIHSDAIVDEITYLASQLPAEDVQDLIDLARSKIKRYERTENLSRKP